MSLSNTAILVGVSISTYCGETLDRAATVDVTTRNNASADAARVIKALLPKSATAEIKRIAGAYRNDTVYHLTLPWAQNGARILPTAVFERFDRETSAARDAWTAERDRILDAWDSLRDDAVRRLGKLGAGEFLTREQVAAKYSWDVALYPIADTADWRISVNKSALDRLQREAEARVQATLAKAQVDIARRIQAVVGNVLDRMETYGTADTVDGGTKTVGAFRDSLIANVAELAEVIPALNLAGDPALAQAADVMRKKLAKFPVAELRESAPARAEAAKVAKKVLSLIDGYV